MMAASEHASSVSSRFSRVSQMVRPTLAPTAMAAKNQRCQPGWSARKLKAAPVLCSSVRLKKGSTSTGRAYSSQALAAYLVARSSTMIATASHSQRNGRCMGGTSRWLEGPPPLGLASGIEARLAGALGQVAHAAAAEVVVACVAAHVLAVVPAALALFVAACGHGHLQAGKLGGLGALGLLALGERLEGHLTGQHHEAQLLAQLGKRRMQGVVHVEGDLGGQAALDGLGVAGILQALVDRLLRLEHLLPEVAAHLGAVVQGGEALVVLLQQHAVAALAGDVLEDLLGGEAEDRGDPASECLHYVVEGCLGAAQRPGVTLGGVLAILDHVQVEAAQLPGAEAVDLLVDVEEAILLVGGLDARLQLGGAVHHPLVQGQHLAEGHGVAARLEAVEVGQQEARGVADAAVDVGGALQDLVGDRHLVAVVGGGNPQ